MHLLTRQEIAKNVLHIRPRRVSEYTRQPDDPLPYLKVGRRLLFDPREVRRWMKRQTNGSNSPLGKNEEKGEAQA